MKKTSDADSMTSRSIPSKYLDRREFLAYSSTAVLVVAGCQSAGDRKVIVGAHPWVYAAKQPQYEITPILEQIFSDLSYAGMEGIELMHTALRPADSVSRINELSHKHSLPVIGTSFEGRMWDRDFHEEVLEDAELIIPRLAKVGGKTLGTSVGRAPQPKSEAQLDAQAEILEEIIAVCESYGVVLNLHNHIYEIENGMHDLRGTLSRLPGIPLGPDLNWLIRGGVDPVKFIREFGSQIVSLHLRDQLADGTWSEALGEGVTDFPSIAAELHRHGFSGPAIIELAYENDFEPSRPLRESLKISRSLVKAVFGY